MPEEYCPRELTGLGNHPQAYSHLGIINAAVALGRAEGGG
jgi:GH15 family glucan-1,4-alpha-glucosidase